MVQIRSITENYNDQFHDFESRIYTSPESIIVGASSLLQLKAAGLVIQLKKNKALLERINSRLKRETFRLQRREAMKSRSFSRNTSQDPMGEALKHGGELRRKIELEFQSYLNHTDFWSRSSSGWTDHVSRLRNVLQNNYSRFKVARANAIVYSLRLQALSQDPRSAKVSPTPDSAHTHQLACMSSLSNSRTCFPYMLAAGSLLA